MTPSGVLSLSFAVMSDEIGRKLYLMMQEAFDGHARRWQSTPITTASVIFLQSKEGDLRADPAMLARAGFDGRAAPCTPTRGSGPTSPPTTGRSSTCRSGSTRCRYLVVVILLLGSLALVLPQGTSAERPRIGQLPFFFLGAGFMLVETKGIAELGLAFGNTWQVIGIVIGAILVMAGRATAGRAPGAVRVPWSPCAATPRSLRRGTACCPRRWYPARRRGGRLATAVILLTLPAVLLRHRLLTTCSGGATEASAALGMNLLGAMAGGLLEYNSMYFGFQSLYWLAIALYATGLALFLSRTGETAEAPSPRSSWRPDIV